MDLESDYEKLLELAAHFQLEDLEELRAGLKGKGRVGSSATDVEYAYDMVESEAKATLQRVRDHRIARSTQRAIREDADILAAWARVEAQETADRRYALALCGGPHATLPVSSPTPGTFLLPSARSTSEVGSAPHRPISQISRASSQASSVVGPIFSILHSIASSQSSIHASTSASTTVEDIHQVFQASKISSVSKRTIPPILELPAGREWVDCIICGDSTVEAYQAPCGCFYDPDCLTDLFEKATVDESLFPPRCCNQHIAFNEVRTIFSPQLVERFERKAEEFGTPNRLYCHNPLCSSFVGPAATNQKARTNKRCKRCNEVTCTFCKGAAHASFVLCPTDPETRQVLALGHQEGWQSCPGCQRMVELDNGCYHMTCWCKYEFCYLCAQQWKNCACPHWDEHLLLSHATRRTHRQQGALPTHARPSELAARQQEVRRVADSLRENHQCAHHRVGFIRGSHGGTCESCGNQSQSFLLQCRGCSMRVCVRCRRNRL